MAAQIIKAFKGRSTCQPTDFVHIGHQEVGGSLLSGLSEKAMWLMAIAKPNMFLVLSFRSNNNK
ncbi:hypothetical protein [Pseudomonas chlororaphis]|uniref:hypothetical protein n=1 Tax=Pseudomonas chlororaphis TaxID=587753 RepID=UPI0018AF7BA4|nr:hypothetical protein [Pseudomonas chlororaphis]